VATVERIIFYGSSTEKFCCGQIFKIYFMNLSKYTVMALAVATAEEATADLKTAPLFSDNMVIQRDTQAAVWRMS
jgi:hypothetical protein